MWRSRSDRRPTPAPRSVQSVIDVTPGPVKEWAIQTFATADKLVLSVLVLAVHRRHRRRRRCGRDAPCPGGQRRHRARRHRRVCSGAVACRRDDGRHRAHVRRNGLRGRGVAACLPRTGSPTNRTPTDAPDSPDRGRRLSLVTLGFSARARSAAWPAWCCRAAGVGVRRPRRVRTAGGRRRRPARAADGAAERRCAAILCHRQCRLLSHRHRTDACRS